MKRKYYLFGLSALAFFAFRLIDTLLFVNPKTGFYDGGSTVLRIVILVALAAVCVFFARKFKPEAGIPEDKARNLPAALFFLLAGLFALIGSASEAADTVKLIQPIGRVITYICCILGILAAVWFFAAAYYYFKGKALFGRYLSVAVILWYCFRALTEFVRAPINANNSVVLVSLASELILAALFLAFGRYLSLEKGRVEFAQKTVSLSLLALVFVFGVGGATVVTYLKAGETSGAILALTDAFAALGGFLAAATFIKKDSDKRNEEQKAD